MGLFKRLFCLLSIALLLSGCWDFKRMRELMFISGIAIEKDDEGYLVGIESLNSLAGGTSQGQQGGGSETKVTVEKTDRPSVELPLHSIQTKLVGEPFYANLQILVIGKKQAEEGIAAIITHFLRDPDMRRTTLVVLADQPIDILKIKQNDERFVANYIKKLVKLTEETGRTITTDIGEISRSIHENKISFIPNITLSKDKKDIEVSGASILKLGKWAGQLSDEECTIIAFIQETAKAGSLNMKCPQSNNGAVTLDIVDTSSSLKPKLRNGKLIIEGHLKVKGYLAEYTCGDGKLQGKTTLNELEKNFNKLLQHNVDSELTAIYKRTGEDVLNIKQILEKDDSKSFEKIKQEFDSLLQSPIININVSVELVLKGTET